MLGHKLVQRLGSSFDVFTTVRDNFDDIEAFGIFNKDKTFCNFDIGDQSRVKQLIEEVRPELVVNAVGIIKQLPSANDVINVLEINSLFPQKLSLLASKLDFRFITVSTDCVFSGKTGNYTEDDVPDAYDLYGQSKRWGEVSGQNSLTLRTSIIGRELRTGHSLVEWFLSNNNGSVKGFSKAIYSGFPTIVFADIIRDVILNQPDLSGVFHVSSPAINKYELLKLIRNAYGLNIEIQKDEEFSIDRSLNSDKYREITGFSPLDWQQMIKQMSEDPTKY